MPRWNLVLALLAAGLAPCVAREAIAVPPEERPNLVIINIDDLGYADIGAFGSTLNRTPHLDRMAAEGRRLTCFYAAPVCSPSRAALMTGCYPKRVLPINSVLFPASNLGLHPDERTLAELLRDAGYQTACIGKWHLGDQPEFLPTRQGFDYYLGIPYSNDMGPVEDGAKSDLGAPLPPRKTVAGRGVDPRVHGGDETGLKGAGQPPIPLLENERVLARIGPEEQQSITARYTEAAVKFLRAEREGPFFLYLPHTAVHFPLYPGKAFQGKSGQGLYGDWIAEVDWSVGQVLDTLRELQLDRRTLVLFTSDNGGTNRAVNRPLRGNKGSTWEGGVRVPTIVWWPGRIPAGAASDEIMGMLDILPTFVGLAGGTLPADRKLDGANLWPLWAGEPGAEAPRDVFYYFRGLTLEAVRQGRWKLHLAQGELYDLVADVGETTNRAESEPETVARLRALAEAMDQDLGQKEVGPGCRPLGRVAKPRPLIDHAGQIRPGFAAP